jgi:hypothetical protein
MNYLSRPVWTFPVNWASQPSTSWAYNLREKQLGFGRPSYDPLQRHVIRGLQFAVYLGTPAAIAEFESFLDATKGRLAGFWIPVPVRLGRIVSAVSPTAFTLSGFGLSDTWTTEASAHVLITAPGGTATAAKIQTVAESGPNDAVAIDTALPGMPDALWSVHRLVYVRFTDDNEKADNLAEGRQERTIRVVELSEEYAAAETGEQPVFLYRFFREIEGVVYSYRFTSFAAPITSGGQTFAAANLSHGAIRRAIGADKEEVKVSAMHDAAAPWACSLPTPSQFPLWVEIAQAQFASPDDVTVLFTGRESETRFTGRNVELTFASWLDSLDSRVPHQLFGPRCPYALYKSACGVDPAAFAVAGTLVAINYQQVIVASGASFAADYFTGGRLHTGSADGLVVRSVLAATADDGAGNVILTINAPLPASVGVSASVMLYPGCDKTNGAGGCQKFGNTRFGGTPFVPRQNLAFAVAEVSGSGGKKGG